MLHKDVQVGPWAKTTKCLDFYRLKLLLNYPEQYRARYVTGTLLVEAQDDLDEELLMSMWAGVDPWWIRVDFDTRRTKGYAAAAEQAVASGLYPVLGHELDTLCARLKLVEELGHARPKLDAQFRTITPVPGGDVVLTSDGVPLLLKICPFDDIERRCWTSDWLTQWLYAAWLMNLSAADHARIIVVDPDAPGRARELIVRANTVSSQAPFSDILSGAALATALKADSRVAETKTAPAFYRPAF